MQFSGAIARRLLRFALPLVPFSLVAFMLMISARLFLQHFQGAEAVGIFSAANRVALILMLVCVTPFQTAWGYLGLDYLRRTDAREIFSRTFTYLLAVSLWAFLIISAVGHAMILRFGKLHYLPALPYVDPLMAGYLAQLFFYWANIVLVGREMTVRILLISLVPFTLSVGGGWLAIPRYGLDAACVIFIAAMTIHAALTAVYAKRIIGFRSEKSRVLKILAVFVFVYGLGQILLCELPQWRVTISFTGIATFPLLLWLFQFLTRGEIARLQELRRTLGIGPR
jgi:O-antigen/teichoic acid export membrane protein